MLTPLRKRAYTVKVSYSFLIVFQNFRNDIYVMANFDGVSIFTNMPVGYFFYLVRKSVTSGFQLSPL